MNAARVSPQKKRKMRSPVEGEWESSVSKKCKRPRFADKRSQVAEASHDHDVTSPKPPRKRKGFNRASEIVQKKKKESRDAGVEGAAAVQPCRRKKRVACQSKRQARDDVDESQLIEELRSGVTSILSGFEARQNGYRLVSSRQVSVAGQRQRASSSDVREWALSKIRAAQFRMLNEELYTTASDDAVESLKSDPQAFQAYHEGFERQVSKWPVNPVDVIIDSLRSMPKSTVIADLGCGEAKIAQELTRNKVHSFDIIALNEHVTVCDMSKLPLPSQTVDVAVFCLSLMGTNLNMFVLEANRILKKGGMLKIAEVKSRFSTTEGFAKTMKKFGFELAHLDESNKMFVLLDFKKARSTTAHPHLPTLKLMPCLYKKR
ncbi:hypothetical protein MRX96_022719 [Rhipicephalus microplus]